MNRDELIRVLEDSLRERTEEEISAAKCLAALEKDMGRTISEEGVEKHREYMKESANYLARVRRSRTRVSQTLEVVLMNQEATPEFAIRFLSMR